MPRKQRLDVLLTQGLYEGRGRFHLALRRHDWCWWALEVGDWTLEVSLIAN